ncbi:MAG: BON domain-containing protein [Georgfuchsia sp.]
MKTTLATSCFVIATLLSPLAAHAEGGDSDRSHPITFVKDSIITTKVKAMLADEKMKTLLHINVDTDANGAVVLSGIARTQEDADKAVSIARNIDGVTSVTSNIQIKKDD